MNKVVSIKLDLINCKIYFYFLMTYIHQCFIAPNESRSPIFTIKDCGDDKSLRWDYSIQVRFAYSDT